MVAKEITIEALWEEANFSPNPNQNEAIYHLNGPLFLPAGPGSGKTRVLLWRTVNLIVFHDIKPEEILLATFTEKAALQLKEGLRALLGVATNHTGKPYDIAKMYVGTMHSLCQRILTDRRFIVNGRKATAPTLMDDLGQYLFLYKTNQWVELTKGLGADTSANTWINNIFGINSNSRHTAVTNLMSVMNRLSEECLTPGKIRKKTRVEELGKLADVYQQYQEMLQVNPRLPRTDFALLQQKALDLLESCPDSGKVFKYVIVDEYQDTNTIQEKLYFKLAEGSKNLCVVGDDDQALYRFRGATVENFVEFPERCQDHFGVKPAEIPLTTNYRSRRQIVDFYNQFITNPFCNWRKDGGRKNYYRVNKDIQAFSQDDGPAVIVNSENKAEPACAEIAKLVKRIIQSGKVENPNQVAFMYPSLKSVQVSRMITALEALGLKVYAPRAGTFLEVNEAIDLFGVFLQVFGQPERGSYGARDYQKFHDWLDIAAARGQNLLNDDSQLRQFVRDRQAEIETSVKDHGILVEIARQHGWDLKAPYTPHKMGEAFTTSAQLSPKAKRSISSTSFRRFVESRQQEGHSFISLNYAINRATSLDWNVLDLFYRLCGFKHFKAMFDLAECGEDEGPICNLSLLSQYLSRFMDEYGTILSGNFLDKNAFNQVFFSSYLYALYRRGESEYEDAEDPFPKGRIPFLTIHQAKGLEFPVVLLGNTEKRDSGPQKVETLVHPLLERKGEPMDRMAMFDIMRMFYVALSRAQNLLIIASYKGRPIYGPFSDILSAIPRIPQFKLASLPASRHKNTNLPNNYSYTADYLLYQNCPRQYMIFRKYKFVPSRSQTMFFGSLVHQTMDDLHQFLITQKKAA